MNTTYYSQEEQPKGTGNVLCKQVITIMVLAAIMLCVTLLTKRVVLHSSNVMDGTYEI